MTDGEENAESANGRLQRELDGTKSRRVDVNNDSCRGQDDC